MASHRAKRSQSQPQGKRNAGCIFKNPPGANAGQLIEVAGLKGQRIGDAEVSTIHANFLVNRGQASSSDFKVLMDLVRDQVQEIHGVALETEVEIWSA
jgi:UDP-N-acetylmuramate dehydrogenase